LKKESNDANFKKNLQYNLKERELKLLKELEEKRVQCLNDDGSLVLECSSVKTCYEWDDFRYENDNCKNTYESCGSWVTDGRLLEGCIMSKYCSTTGTYLGDDKVEFECPDGAKTWPNDDMKAWPR
jgi:hypothetical protein